MQELGELVRIVIFGMLIIIFLYVSVRTVSWAYFRTRLEHFRSMLKVMKEGD